MWVWAALETVGVKTASIKTTVAKNDLREAVFIFVFGLVG